MKRLPHVRPDIQRKLKRRAARVDPSIAKMALSAMPSPKMTPSQYIRESVRTGMAFKTLHLAICKALAELPVSCTTARTLRSLRERLSRIRWTLDSAACSIIPARLDRRNLAIRLYFGQALNEADIKELIQILESALPETGELA